MEAERRANQPLGPLPEYEGGDPECQHVEINRVYVRRDDGSVGLAPALCGKCGARRIGGGEKAIGQHYGDTGGAFRYIAKASRAERNAGLEGFEEAITDDGRQTPISNPYLRGKTKRQNVHPTVKPVDLMRWLVRLVTPPDGVVLDPFAGSGTTGIACVFEDFDFIGIEREPDYVEIAKARIDYWAKQPKQLDLLGKGMSH